jgi:hypothetical protein
MKCVIGNAFFWEPPPLSCPFLSRGAEKVGDRTSTSRRDNSAPLIGPPGSVFSLAGWLAAFPCEGEKESTLPVIIIVVGAPLRRDPIPGHGALEGEKAIPEPASTSAICILHLRTCRGEKRR